MQIIKIIKSGLKFDVHNKKLNYPSNIHAFNYVDLHYSFNSSPIAEND